MDCPGLAHSKREGLGKSPALSQYVVLVQINQLWKSCIVWLFWCRFIQLVSFFHSFFLWVCVQFLLFYLWQWRILSHQGMLAVFFFLSLSLCLRGRPNYFGHHFSLRLEIIFALFLFKKRMRDVILSFFQVSWSLDVSTVQTGLPK